MAIKFALESGPLFDINQQGLFTKTILNKCVDAYIKQWSEKGGEPIDKRLEDIVNRLFERCFKDQTYNHAIGIAIESHRLDIVRKAIIESWSFTEKINYTYEIALKTIVSKDYWKEILKILVEIY